MNKEDLPGLLVAAFGLSPEELTALKILRPSFYPMVDCTDDFGLLLTRRPICIVLNPVALDGEQRDRLNEHMWTPDGPVFLVTRDTEGILSFPTLCVNLTARQDRVRSRIMKQLKDTDVDPFFAFSRERSAASIMLNDGFIVLDADMNTYARAPKEIIRISAAYVAGFECLDRFETLVRAGLPVSRDVTEDTWLTDESLSGAPSLAEALQMLDNWRSFDVALAAYNWEHLAPSLSAVRERFGYEFGEGRVKLDMRKLLLRMFPAYFSQNHMDIDSAMGLIPWWTGPHESWCEKLTDLFTFMLRYLWQDYGIRSVADILQLYRDNDLSRSNLNDLIGGYE